MHAEDDDGRRRGVKTKKAKDRGDKIRINRRNPSSRAGIGEKRRAEPLPSYNVGGDAADFRSERSVRMRVAHVSLLPEYKAESQHEAANKKKKMEVAVIRGASRNVGFRGRFLG